MAPDQESGQTSVEYMLLVAVMITVGVSFFDRFEAYLVDNPDSFINSTLGSYSDIMGGGGINAQYKRFSIRR